MRGGLIMAKTDTLHIRVEPDVKSKVEETLNKLGLSTAEAVNIFLRQIMLTGGLPFDVKLPRYNAETETAMEEARKISSDKSVRGFMCAEDLFNDLKK
jgi:DNA-damage-inducible protein J